MNRMNKICLTTSLLHYLKVDLVVFYVVICQLLPSRLLIQLVPHCRAMCHVFVTSGSQHSFIILPFELNKRTENFLHGEVIVI